MGAGVYSLALYGGLILFGGFMLYDTQKIIYRAERHPVYGAGKFDPINSSLGIYADTLNIFIRIAQILAMQGGGKRK
jgi:FtsH-binding integral membrane protein